MALHTELSVNIAVFGETAKDTNKFDMVFSSLVLDTLVLEASARVKLAAAASDIAVAFQSVTNGQLILLKSDNEFSVKINGSGNPALTLKPQTHSGTLVKTPAFLCMMADSVTSLHLTNASASAPIEVDVGMAGVA